MVAYLANTLGENLERYPRTRCETQLPVGKAPLTFDGRKVWGRALGPVMDQGACGSCYAFACAAMLGDRFNIRGDRGDVVPPQPPSEQKGKYYFKGGDRFNIRGDRGDVVPPPLVLSPTRLVLCNYEQVQLAKENSNLNELDKRALSSNESFGVCYGNTVLNTLEQLYIFGTCELRCMPYEILEKSPTYFQRNAFTNFQNDPARLPFCTLLAGPVADMCDDYYLNTTLGISGGTPQRFYRCMNIWLYQNNADVIATNIYHFGPVVTSFRLYDDFTTVAGAGNVYSWDGKAAYMGTRHAVEIVGWGGNVGGEQWWLIKNSWGTQFGDKGYCKIRKGVNECGIEENVMGATPDNFYTPAQIKALDTTVYSRTAIQSKAAIRDREAVISQIDMVAGGIDPTTGYSRRVNPLALK